MVTMILAIVIVGAVYLLYSQSVSASRIEMQVLDMQDRLRFGLEHLKRDLRRGAFLATPNSDVDDNVCPGLSDTLRAMVVKTDDGTVYNTTDNVNIEPSSVTLFGDFFSGKVYRTAGVQGSTVFFQATDNFPTSEVEFERIFDPYSGTQCRYLRIVTKDQFEFYSPIVSVTFVEGGTSSVVLADTIPLAGGGTLCGITGFGEGLDVNVAGFIRYRVLADSRPNAPTGKTDLVREELQVNGSDAVYGSQLVIAEYAVDMQFYDFGFDIDTTGTNPTIAKHQYVTGVADEAGGGLLGNTSSATPHRLRYLTVKMTVRTVNEDGEFPFTPRESLFGPITAFELDDMAGSCRVSTLASRVELTSLAVRNMTSGVP